MRKVVEMSSFKDFLKKRIKQPSFRGSTGSVLGVRGGEVAIATYASAADKAKTITAFIREGLERGERIFYFYPDEENETLRTDLKEHGLDVEKHERDGNLYMKSLTEHFMPEGCFDKDRSIQFLLKHRAKAKKQGYKVREIEDVGDFSFLKGQWQRYLDYWNDPRWGVRSGVGVIYEPFIIELTAVNVGSMSDMQTRDILESFGGGKRPHIKFIDLLGHANAFSKKIDTTHEKLLGCKFLLEFDPTSNYEVIVKDFAKEAMANVEPVVVFTANTSSVRTCLAKQRAVKFFLMSVSTSTQESISENEILLPANNTALALDSLSKVLETYVAENIFLVFDNLSELIRSIGLEKTYCFLHYMLDLVSSARVTALFLFNAGAHVSQVTSCLRELFPNQLMYEEKQLKVIKCVLSQIQ